jgi:hypothetical protein
MAAWPPGPRSPGSASPRCCRERRRKRASLAYDEGEIARILSFSCNCGMPGTFLGWFAADGCMKGRRLHEMQEWRSRLTAMAHLHWGRSRVGSPAKVLW